MEPNGLVIMLNLAGNTIAQLQAENQALREALEALKPRLPAEDSDAK